MLITDTLLRRALDQKPAAAWTKTLQLEVGNMFRMVASTLLVLFLGLGSSGCSKWFWGGAATGAAGAGAAYEYQNKRQMDQLEEDYEQGRIDREEYERRKEQIEEGSIIY